MKFYSFVTFTILIACSDGSIGDEKSIRKHFYSSYGKYSAKLKEIGLETRIVDLDEIYQIGFQQVTELQDFLQSNADLIKNLLENAEKLSSCLNNDLTKMLDGHRARSEELWQALVGASENSSFYEDLIDYFEDIKQSDRDKLRHNKIYNGADTFYVDKKSDLQRLRLALVDEDDVKFYFEEIVEDYLDEMTADVETRKSLENIQKLSGKFVEICKEKIKVMVVDLKENGMLDKDRLINATEEFRNDEKLCQNMLRDLEVETNLMESFALRDAALIEKFARADIFLVDGEGKKSLDCGDPVPYYGAKPGERVISWTMDNDEVTFYLRGKDETGRSYKRTYTSENTNESTAQVREIIEYDDKIFDRKYIFEFKKSV